MSFEDYDERKAYREVYREHKASRIHQGVKPFEGKKTIEDTKGFSIPLKRQRVSWSSKTHMSLLFTLIPWRQFRFVRVQYYMQHFLIHDQNV